MAKKKGSAGEILKGRVVQGESADWEALENVISYHACDEFMWMFEVELEERRRVGSPGSEGTSPSRVSVSVSTMRATPEPCMHIGCVACVLLPCLE